MFAMLIGPWPRVLDDGTSLAALEAGVARGEVAPGALGAAVERAVDEALAAQVEAGLGLVTDGLVRWADPWSAIARALDEADTGADGLLARAWRAAAGRTDRPVAAVVPGPWTLAGRGAAGHGRALELAGELAGELEALAEAGCPVAVVLEPDAVSLGAARALDEAFRAAQERLLDRAGGLHPMLAVTGGAPPLAAAPALVGAPYASYLFDLVAGPDNWRLVRAVPGDRGVVAAALEAGDGRERRDQAPELAWAAQYAASAGGRGLDRVGLANGSPLDALAPGDARAALAALGQAAVLAGMSAARAVEAGLDPRVLPHGRLPPPAPVRAPRGPKRAPLEPGDPPAGDPGERR